MLIPAIGQQACASVKELLTSPKSREELMPTPKKMNSLPKAKTALTAHHIDVVGMVNFGTILPIDDCTRQKSCSSALSLSKIMQFSKYHLQQGHML
jgi:hypothetical protein